MKNKPPPIIRATDFIKKNKKGFIYGFVFLLLAHAVMGSTIFFIFISVLFIIFTSVLIIRKGREEQVKIKIEEGASMECLPEEKKIKFSDVGGCDEAIEQLKDLVDFLKNPMEFAELGCRMPRGYLLVGPPGTGKTLLARAIAGEANVPFFSEKGTDFVEIFVGTGMLKMKRLFKKAKKKVPCVIFIDELDSIGRKRSGAVFTSGAQEYENTMLQLCAEMDGFEENNGIALIGATNRPDSLDPALVRSGRFDTSIIIDRPDLNGRKAIIGIHIKKVKLLPDLNAENLIDKIARSTTGLVGSDLGNLINKAAIKASRKNAKFVEENDFLEVLNEILMGGMELKGKLMDKKERKTIAYHEAGHTVVAWNLPDTDPVSKVSIIRRGKALGVTLIIPEIERHILFQNYILNQLKILNAGRMAEKLFIGEISTGPEDDIKKATLWARQMVCRWGMSDSIGPVCYADSNDKYLEYMDSLKRTECSEDTNALIDREIKRLLIESEKAAFQILDKNKEKTRLLTEALLEKETLEYEEIKKILNSPKT